MFCYRCSWCRKTLVGLDVAIKQTYKEGEKDKDNGAVYLSGNGPLVAVLTEALAQDNQKNVDLKENERIFRIHEERFLNLFK